MYGRLLRIIFFINSAREGQGLDRAYDTKIKKHRRREQGITSVHRKCIGRKDSDLDIDVRYFKFTGRGENRH